MARSRPCCHCLAWELPANVATCCALTLCLARNLTHGQPAWALVCFGCQISNATSSCVKARVWALVFWLPRSQPLQTSRMLGVPCLPLMIRLHSQAPGARRRSRRHRCPGSSGSCQIWRKKKEHTSVRLASSLRIIARVIATRSQSITWP